VSDKTDYPPLPEAFAALGIRPSLLKGLAGAAFVTELAKRRAARTGGS
jgi:hypothetical protein